VVSQGYVRVEFFFEFWGLSRDYRDGWVGAVSRSKVRSQKWCVCVCVCVCDCEKVAWLSAKNVECQRLTLRYE